MTQFVPMLCIIVYNISSRVYVTNNIHCQQIKKNYRLTFSSHVQIYRFVFMFSISSNCKHTVRVCSRDDNIVCALCFKTMFLKCIVFLLFKLNYHRVK